MTIPAHLQPATIYATVAGDDHNWNNLQGYLMGFYAQLPNPPTPEEFELISHISCFAFNKETTSHTLITELAKRIYSKSQNLESRKRMVRTRLASLKEKGLIVVKEIKAPDGGNYPSLIDMRPILKKTRQLAEKARWFEEEPKGEGVTSQSGGGDSVVRGGMTDESSQIDNINLNKGKKELTTLVTPTGATVATAQLPTLTPIEHREPIRLIFTIGKRGTSKRHYATTPDGFEPLCGGSKRSGKSTGAGWGYECTHDLNYVDLCQDCAAIAAGEKPAPTPKPRRLVDMTNLELERPQPAGLSPDKLKEWFKQKPFADFFANWEVWNRTEGFQDRTLAGYKASALPDDRKEIYIIASQLGGELERLAKNNNITFTLELLSAFEDWYLDNTFQEKPMAEKKFPTTIDKFRRNILLYLNYLRQLERAS